jgi:hypothetical protein
VSGHEGSQFLDVHVRPKGAWAGTHDLLNDLVVPRLLELLRLEDAEHYPMVVHHHTLFPPGLLDPFPHRTHPFVQVAGGNVWAGHVGGSGKPGDGALTRQTSGEPVLLAGGVVVHPSEAQTLEPPRGSCAQVSGRVPTVDDDGT